MEIKVRDVGAYKEVIFSHGGTRIDMGLLDKAELRELAMTLEEAVDALTEV